MDDTKKCSKCGEVKLLAEFNKDKSRRDGFQSQCRNCRNEEKRLAHSINPGAKREIDHRYKEANRDRINASQREKLKDTEYAESLNAKRRAKWLANPEPFRERGRKYQQEHREESKLRSAKWRAENPERFADGVRRWHELNPGVKSEIGKRHKRKKLSTPKGKLEAHISRGVRRGLLVGSKNGRSTFKLLDFTADELKVHLEKQFSVGMSWENYGEWHIDHIVPLAAHNYQTPDDIDFKRAWALSNLQPLWARDNMAKGDRLLGSFQPSLLLEIANDNSVLEELSA